MSNQAPGSPSAASQLALLETQRIFIEPTTGHVMGVIYYAQAHPHRNGNTSACPGASKPDSPKEPYAHAARPALSCPTPFIPAPTRIQLSFAEYAPTVLGDVPMKVERLIQGERHTTKFSSLEVEQPATTK